jgi:hypothetical protein
MAAIWCHYPVEFQASSRYDCNLLLSLRVPASYHKISPLFPTSSLASWGVMSCRWSVPLQEGPHGVQHWHQFHSTSDAAASLAPAPPLRPRQCGGRRLWGYNAGASPGSSCVGRRHDEEVADLIKLGWGTTDDTQAPSQILGMESLPSTGRAYDTPWHKPSAKLACARGYRPYSHIEIILSCYIW